MAQRYDLLNDLCDGWNQREIGRDSKILKADLKRWQKTEESKIVTSMKCMEDLAEDNLTYCKGGTGVMFEAHSLS